MSMFKGWKKWLYGILEAMIQGGASAVSSGIATIVINPEKFNFNDTIGALNVLKAMAIGFVLNAAYALFQELKKKPLPEMGDDTAFITKPPQL